VLGTEKAELLALRLTVAPPAGAGPLNVAVTVANVPVARLFGTMFRELNVRALAVVVTEKLVPSGERPEGTASTTPLLTMVIGSQPGKLPIVPVAVPIVASQVLTKPV
jgi:hypothetical protein